MGNRRSEFTDVGGSLIRVSFGFSSLLAELQARHKRKHERLERERSRLFCCHVCICYFLKSTSFPTEDKETKGQTFVGCGPGHDTVSRTQTPDRRSII